MTCNTHSTLTASGRRAEPTPRGGAFTLVELLVVIAIIALLISMLMPSLNNARDEARRVVCASQLRQISNASATYAADFSDALPYRGKRPVTIPHAMMRDPGGPDPYDLNVQFIKPYLVTRDKIMFCPSRLLEARHPDLAVPDYQRMHVTYQYFNMPLDSADAFDSVNRWNVPQPDLSRFAAIRVRSPLWSCMTLRVGGTYFGHDRPIASIPPTGLNAAWSDGAAAWATWAECENYYTTADNGQFWYWPIKFN